MDNEKPSFWALLPAPVRYDQEIPTNAKLLYAEVSALVGKDGYCFAANSYFVDVFQWTEETVSRLLTRLEKAGYIRRTYQKDKAGKVVGRRIYLDVSATDGQPLDFKINPRIDEKINPTFDEKIKDTKSITSIKEKVKKEKADTLPLEDVCQLATDWIGKTFPEWPAKSKNDLWKHIKEFYSPREDPKKNPSRTAAGFAGFCRNLMRYGSGDCDRMLWVIDRALENQSRGLFPLPEGSGVQRAGPKPEDGETEWL